MSESNHRDASPAVRLLLGAQHALFVLLWLTGTGFAVARRGDEPAWVLPLAAGMALWYGLGIVVARRSTRGWIARGWVLVLIAVWMPLAVASPGMRYLALALFLLALHLWGTVLGLVLVAELTGFVIVVQVTEGPRHTVGQVVGPLVGALVAVGVAGGYLAVLRESRRNRDLVAELTRAHEDLEAMQTELARVQRETGALAERSRLARDIHDTLAQGLSSILLLSRAGRADPVRAAALLTQIETTAAENLDEARRVVHALAPAELSDAPLPAALQRLLDRLTSAGGPAGELMVTGDVRPLPTAVEVGLLRLAQGALANVGQHAGATRVVVSIDYGPDAVSLDVVDDGRGFDPATTPSRGAAGGFGLRAMRERMADLGGTLAVESSPGDGTAIAARIELRGAS